MKTLQKIVLKYVQPDPWFAAEGKVYVGMNHPETELRAVGFRSVEEAKFHSGMTAEPTEVKLLTITIQEMNAPS